VSCIHCGSADRNDEHHLPRRLGNFKGYMVLTQRVQAVVGRLSGKSQALTPEFPQCRTQSLSYSG
jgi:hypothetical protein